MRVHFQLGRFMRRPDRSKAANLDRLAKLVRLAEEIGLYLDITGLGCYHKKDVPAWSDVMDESDRWDVQARFWKAVAGVCKGNPAVFCYDLMNEPIVAGEGEEGLVPGEPLGESITSSGSRPKPGPDRQEIARAWVGELAPAIRSVDARQMITVGVIPWAQVFKGAKPFFYAPEVCRPLDFVSVHFYPKAGELGVASTRSRSTRSASRWSSRRSSRSRPASKKTERVHRPLAGARRWLGHLLLGQDDRGVREGG